MQTKYDAIIVGAGAMGSAAAYHLAADGLRVLVLEQFALGHALGSSHGESRIFRFAYTDSNYARLAMQCRPLWHALEKQANVELLRLIGGLDLGHDDVGLTSVQEVSEALQAIGAVFEELTPAQLAARFPQWRVPEQTRVLYSPDTGFVWADRAVNALRAQAVILGATIQDNEPVQRIVPHDAGAEVITAKGIYRADKIIITAGAWANAMLGYVGLQLPLRIEREQLHYFAPRLLDGAFKPERFPIWIHYGREIGYGFPMLGADGYPAGVKCGFHHDRHYIEPDNLARVPNREVEARMRRYLETYLPDAAGELLTSMCCLYSNTPDEHFVVDVVPGYPHIALASPCSGHGFKFSIGIGRALADLVQRGETDMHIGYVRLKS